MNESYLQYLFECRKLGNSFQTTNGETLEVLTFGQHNKSSGPDFLEASVKFENKIWAGHIEFHFRSSDWINHGHQNDQAYENVIAHFVYEHDKNIYSGKYLLPVIELKNIVNPEGFEPFQKFTNSKNWIPCEKAIQDIDYDIIKSQMSIVLDDRIKRKRNEVLSLFKSSKNDHKKVLFTLIAKTLGGKHNSNAMETLINKIDFNTIAHLNHDIQEVSTYILGLSGLDCSPEFEYQRSLFQLSPMSPTNWKTFGMRPGSRPEKRIVQLGILICSYPALELNPDKKTWKNFFSIDSNRHVSKFSKSMIDLFLINAVVPFFMALGWFKNDFSLQEKSLMLLQSIDAEQNQLISKWKKLNVIPKNASESQALIELKNKHCNQKKCLFCSVGKKVLNA